MTTSYDPGSIAEYTRVLDGPFSASPRVQRWARPLVIRQLERLQWGHLRLFEGDSVTTYGRGESAHGEAPLDAEIHVQDDRFFSKLALGGSIGAAEAFMAGHWTSGDLTSVLRLVLRHRDLLDGMEKGWARLAAPLRQAFHAVRSNTRSGSRRNIFAHYDLGNDFFDLFLDPRRMYSCAVFERPDTSLEEASIAKLDRICRKLDLQPTDHVVEIGTGWGGFALHAAAVYGCRVTTTTISQSQFEHARKAVEAAGLEDLVEVVQKDYRDLTGRYDKLVSIEMIEAVGDRFLDTFFGKCSDLLKPEGLMVLQGITIADQHFERYRRSVDFIQRYIFPGSQLISVGSLATSVARATDLRMVHLEDIGPHYALTLCAWCDRFLANREKAQEMGFAEPFLKMWEYYFCYCEAGFEERSIGDVQVVLAKPANQRPVVLGDLA